MCNGSNIVTNSQINFLWFGALFKLPDVKATLRSPEQENAEEHHSMPPSVLFWGLWPGKN